MIAYGDAAKDQRLEAVLPPRMACNLGQLVVHADSGRAVSGEWHFRLDVFDRGSNDGGLGVTPAVGLADHRAAIAAPAVEPLSAAQRCEKLLMKRDVSRHLLGHR